MWPAKRRARHVAERNELANDLNGVEPPRIRAFQHTPSPQIVLPFRGYDGQPYQAAQGDPVFENGVFVNGPPSGVVPVPVVVDVVSASNSFNENPVDLAARWKERDAARNFARTVVEQHVKSVDQARAPLVPDEVFEIDGTIVAEESSLDRPSSTEAQEIQHPLQPPVKTLVTPSTESFSRPTCSLNLLCYRAGRDGCLQRQIQVVDVNLGSTIDAEKLQQQNPKLISNDEDFFLALHREYEQHLCGFWRRYFSLKTLRQIRLLSVRTPSPSPAVTHY